MGIGDTSYFSNIPVREVSMPVSYGFRHGVHRISYLKIRTPDVRQK